MRIFKPWMILLLMASSLPAAREFNADDIGGGSFITRRNSLKPKAWDQNELSMAVEETRSLADALARESRLATPTAEALYLDLKEGFKLKGAVKPARKALAQAEAVIGFQEQIKALQAELKGLSGTAADAAEGRLLSAQEGLVKSNEDLVDRLISIHKDLSENQLRDFKAWLMVSEGRLRKVREEAPVTVTPTSTPTPRPRP